MKSLSLFTVIAVLSFPFLCVSQGYKMRTWGYDALGENALNRLNNTSNLVAISSFFLYQGEANFLWLKEDGSVDSGGLSSAQVPTGLTNVVMIAAGAGRGLALKADGSIICFGGFSSPPSGIFTTIGAGKFHFLAVRPDGSVVAWDGLPQCPGVFPLSDPISCGETVVPISATNVVAVTGGDKHSLALRSDGTVVAWGGNDNGQINVPSNLSNVVSIAAGAYMSYALKSDGTVIRWGGGSAGALAVSNVVSIATGGSSSVMALKSDGTIYGADSLPPDLTFAVAVTGGYGSYAALVTDTPVYSPVISKHPLPTSQTAAPGSSVIYKVSVIGVPPYQYQWLFNNNPLSGKTNSTLQLLNLQWPNSGSYSVIVSNSVGAVVSAPAILSVMSSLNVHLIPRITLGGDIGYTYRLEYINAVGPTNQWMLLDMVSITNNPQFYYDNSALGLSQRFYRLAFTNAP